MLNRRIITMHIGSNSDPSIAVSAGHGMSGKPTFATFDENDPELSTLRRQNRVRLEAPSFKIRLVEPLCVSASSDSQAPPLVSWGIEATGADHSSFDGSGVIVAVLDTGIDRRHPAFEGVDIDEEDFTGEGPGDANGHGTHCAGTICGQDVDGTRIGIARGIKKLLVGKVLGKTGSGSTEAILDALQWSVKSGANIISMSLGMDFPGVQAALVEAKYPPQVATSLALEGYRNNVRLFDKVTELINSGEFFNRRALIVAATGNESRRDVSGDYIIAKGPPAAADGILAVGALQKTDNKHRPYRLASFSNSKAGIAAPGVKIWSAATGGGLKALSGTSMATPHVAGIAALWAQKSLQDNDGEIVIGDVLDNLRFSAQKIEEIASEDVGRGLVQAPK